MKYLIALPIYGMINATKMLIDIINDQDREYKEQLAACETDAERKKIKKPVKRLLKNWLRNEDAKILINAVSESSGEGLAHQRADEVLKEIANLPNHLKGTYAHPDLIVHIVSWASPKFAIKVSKIVNSFFVRESEEKIAEQIRLLAEKDSVIKTKDSSIDRLEKMIIEMRKENKKDATHRDVQHNRLEEKLDNVQDHLTNVLPNHAVPPKATAKREHLIIIRNPNLDQDGDEYEFRYYVMRRQEAGVSGVINAYIKKNPGAKLLYQIKAQPNARKLYARICEELEEDLYVRSNNFSIAEDSNMTEKELINNIKRIDGDKYKAPKYKGWISYIGPESEI